MTHQPIFYEIAEAYGTPFEERTKRQVKLTTYGLCWAIDSVVCFESRWAIDVEYIFIKILNSYGFWLPTRITNDLNNPEFLPKHDNLRCLAALFFWAMSTKDFNQMMEGK